MSRACACCGWPATRNCRSAWRRRERSVRNSTPRAWPGCAPNGRRAGGAGARSPVAGGGGEPLWVLGRALGVLVTTERGGSELTALAGLVAPFFELAGGFTDVFE